MKSNEEILKSQKFISFLEDKKNKIIYLNYLHEPSRDNSIKLNEAYKSFERQLMVRAYLKKAIYYEARKFDQKVRNKEKQKITMDRPLEDGTTLGDFLVDEDSSLIYEKIWNVKLEEIFEDINLYKAINNLTSKQKK